MVGSRLRLELGGFAAEMISSYLQNGATWRRFEAVPKRSAGLKPLEWNVVIREAAAPA
jgi:hypothetical protein